MEGQAGSQTNESGNGDGTSTVTATASDNKPEKLSNAELLELVQKQAGQISELTASVKSLRGVQSDFDKLQKERKEAEEAAAKEAGNFKELYEKAEATIKQHENEIASWKRNSEIDQAVETAEGLAFGIPAVKEMSKRVDADTGGTHTPAELIELATKKLESWGLSTKPETLALGATGSTGAGPRDAEAVETAELKALYKKGQDGDLTAQREYIVKESMWRTKHPGQPLPAMDK
jgi:hypothetical protein